MRAPRIVTPQGAQGIKPRLMGQEAAREVLAEAQAGREPPRWAVVDLAHTVATEPERIAAAERAAVVRFLRHAGSLRVSPQTLIDWADGLEDGEPLTIKNVADW